MCKSHFESGDSAQPAATTPPPISPSLLWWSPPSGPSLHNHFWQEDTLRSDTSKMTSWVFKYQHVNVEIYGEEKDEAVRAGPAGRELDYWSRSRTAGAGGDGDGIGVWFIRFIKMVISASINLCAHVARSTKHLYLFVRITSGSPLWNVFTTSSKVAPDWHTDSCFCSAAISRNVFAGPAEVSLNGWFF